MTIQLTKTKTIEIGGKGGRRRKPVDVTGVELFGDDPRGCPAVRLVEKKGVLRIASVGFVPPPANPLPDSWEAAAKGCSWSLAAPFQAPRAALAVVSPDMFLAQTTLEAVRQDIAAGAHRQEESSVGPKVRKLGIRREEKPKAESAAKPTALPDVEPGIPVSNGGTRFVMRPMGGAEGFVMEAGLPEYQVLWLSRLLPEGRRPTAASIQLAPLARAAGILRQRAFVDAGGTALALFVERDGVLLAGYRGGELVLWRRCRNAPGWEAVREAVKKGLGLGDDMIASVLDEGLIDPRPVVDPILAPVMDELAVSRDYLVGKLGAEPKQAFVFGLPEGARCWSALAEERAHLPLATVGLFDGLEPLPRHFAGEGAALDGIGSQAFLGALGAALALAGEEAAS